MYCPTVTAQPKVVAQPGFSVQPRDSITIPPGDDITDFVGRHRRYNEFLLVTGEYPAGNGVCITRSHIVIRKKSPADQPRITEPMQIAGDDNVFDGLIWDADINPDIRRSDPGTLTICGQRDTVRNCQFRNFRSTVNGNKILVIGRMMIEGNFTNTVADDNTIESCTFDNWGLRDEPKGSLKSSACIVVGREDDKGKFTGTRIRNNLFINGPYKQYGYNAACKVFNSVLVENNIFSGGQECMEMKFGNSTIRGNSIHHFSGYNVLANRGGRNSLYENNTVYDVEPIDSISRAQGFMIWECGNTVFRNNLVYDCQITGRIPGRETPGNTLMEYLLIEHNSFINNKRGIVFEAKTGSPRHLVITRNIFYNSAGAAFRALENVDTASLDYFAGNIYDGPVQEIGDEAPVRVYPQFKDTASQDFRLSNQSPACGYGAFPCSTPAAPSATAPSPVPPSDLSHYVVLYPTKDKWIVHIGLVGLDIHPLQLEVDDLSGNTLVRRGSPEPGYDLFANIDLGTSHLQDYLIKLHTDKGDITKTVHIDGNAER
jgi:hypothetical protein